MRETLLVSEVNQPTFPYVRSHRIASSIPSPISSLLYTRVFCLHRTSVDRPHHGPRSQLVPNAMSTALGSCFSPPNTCQPSFLQHFLHHATHINNPGRSHIVPFPSSSFNFSFVLFVSGWARRHIFYFRYLFLIVSLYY